MREVIRRRRRLILVVMAITAVVFQFGYDRLKAPEAHAQAETLFTAAQVFGLASGQKARFCIGTLTPRGPTLDWSIPISDERGVLLLQLPETNSPAGEWRCLDIPRNSLPSGEAGTGRVQVAAVHLVRAPKGTKPSDIIGSFEVVNGDGTSEGAVAAVLYATLHNND